LDPKSFVYSAVVLLVAASIAVAAFRHFGLGSVLGLLVAGIFIGPHTQGPSLISQRERHLNLSLLHSLHGLGYGGQIAITAQALDDVARLEQVGADLVQEPFADAAR